jgi:hypothetical protein
MYSAESLIRSLKSNGDLMFEGIDEIKCPNPANVPCENTINCVTGAKQECKQKIKIFQEQKLLRVLIVQFMISAKVNKGFIRKDDSALTSLMHHKIVNKALLT